MTLEMGFVCVAESLPQRARPLGFRKRGGRPTKHSVTAARDRARRTICAHTSSSVWRARCDCTLQRPGTLFGYERPD
jgi:hypothetical protein